MDEQDYSDKGDAKARRWFKQLKVADKSEEDWRKEARKAICTYRGEEKEGHKPSSFNILWANIEALRPALLNAQPKPDVRQRIKTPDPIARAVAELLERALAYSMDQEDFACAADGAVFDYCLAGRGAIRSRYKPEFDTSEPSEDGEQIETLRTESVVRELVPWERLRVGPAKRWIDVPWISFEHHLTRADLREKWPKVASDIPLVIGTDHRQGDDKMDPDDCYSRARVFEIWDKDTRTIIWMAEGYDQILQEDEDPLGLEGFFDCPEPIYAVETTDSLVPICEYTLYRTQAEELNKVSTRITKLISGLRNNGVYDSTIAEMSQLMQAGDNEFIPAANVSALIEGKGLDKAIWQLPIKQIAEVLSSLYVQRDQIKDVIYELTGLSDIVRGSSDPKETATAQQLKSQYGSLRLQRRQREVQVMLRGVVRITAEIIAERFQPQTLFEMTGIQPDEQMLQILRSDAMRSFKIDIETDSTIQGDEQADKAALAELMTGLSNFAGGMAPMVQLGILSPEQIKAIIKAATRRFKLGREVEDVLDQQQQGQDPAQMAQQMQQMQQQLQQMGQELQKAQSGVQEAQIKAQADQQTEQQKLQGQLQIEQIKQQGETQREQMRLEAEFRVEQMRAQMKLREAAMRPMPIAA